MPLRPSVLPMSVSTSLDTNGNRGTSAPHPKAAIRHQSVPTSIARILRCAPTPLQAAQTYPAPKGGAHRMTDSLFRRKPIVRSEEHTSELQSLMRISYAVFCLKKKINNTNTNLPTQTT